MTTTSGRNGCAPALLLFFFAPVIPELLTSCPLADYFNPFRFLVNAVLYGGGALLARELVLRWRKGWASLLILGCTYAMFEEGLMVKSFFNPGHGDLGSLSSFGRWAGVNWVWAENMIFAHAVLSIILPITLVSLAFPRRLGEAWVGRGILVAVWVFFLANGVMGFFFWPPYRPPAVPYAVTCMITIGLFIVARLVPAPAGFPDNVPSETPPSNKRWPFAVVGLFVLPVLYLPAAVLQRLGAHPIIVVLVAVAMVAVMLWTIARMSGYGTTWDAYQQFALAAGILTPLVLFMPVWEFLVPNPPDLVRGKTFVAIGTVLFLVWVARRLSRLGGRPLFGTGVNHE